METLAYEEASGDRVEGIARVVAVWGNEVLLEPEQTTSCGGCSAGGMCGVKGIGTVASRLEARRFSITQPGLTVGERVVVGVRPTALLHGALTAYALPLVSLFAAAAAAQTLAGSDAVTLLAALTGLAFGLAGAQLLARGQARRGALAPQFLRRAAAGESCHID